MSILVEIADKAEVPVEGVIRVLTREPVSENVMARVLAVLDDLTPEQTRAVQRFALAALHDVLPRPLAAEPEEVNPGQLTLPVAPEGDQVPVPLASEAALVELSSVLSELAEAVRDLRRETDAERRERVDDLAVLIDLITTGWQGLDARLGRIEKQVARIDASRHPSVARVPVTVPVPAAPVPPPDELTETPVAAAVEPRGWRSRLPLAAALIVAGAVIGSFAVLQLSSDGPDVAALVAARDEPAGTGVGSSSTTGEAPSESPTTTTATTPRTTTQASPPAAPPAAGTTSSILGTTVGATRPARTPPATTAKRTATTPATPSFKPTRNWAWAPVPDADYYSVQFTRGGKAFYKATPNEPRLTLPQAVVFAPGTYRWVVRAGFGPKTANRLGPPVVDSGFTVS